MQQDILTVLLSNTVSMLSDHLYNLMAQITEESKALKRIRENYQKDHGGCDSCAAFWDKMEKDKEEHVEELKGLIKEHLDAE